MIPDSSLIRVSSLMALPGGLTIRQATQNSRVMQVGAGTTTLWGLTLTGGDKLDSPPFDGKGGAVLWNRGFLIVRQCTFRGNSAAYGGAIYNAGGRLYVSDSTFHGNAALIAGGAIFSSDTDLQSLPSMTAGFIGFSTISGNSATLAGGGIHHQDASTPLSLGNVIVAGNTSASGPDYLGSMGAGGGVNLIGDPSGSIGLRADDLTGDPRLAPLDYWGGTTQTMPPLPGSPVIDAVVLPLIRIFLSSRDQYGVARIPGYPVELGSLEAIPFSNFPLTDIDGDQIDDRLEAAYPQLTVGVDDSSLDSDGDGSPDGQELNNMTDPDDPNDKFQILSVEMISTPGFANSNLSVEFSTFPGLRYEVETASSSLEFQPLSNSTITASGTSEKVSVPLPPGQNFIRVRQRAN